MLARFRTALARAFSRPRAPLVLVLLALLCAAPSIELGFFADDDWFLASLEHRMPLARSGYDLYRFAAPPGPALQAEIAAGELPWWTAPGLRLHLVRPLASLLFTADHALFGRWSPGYHLHALIWYAALLLAVRAVYRRVLPGATGTVALAVFAFHEANVNAYAWISARYLLVAATPAFLGLLAHVRLREQGWRPGAWLAPAGLITGLLGGEAALGGFAFLLAYEIAGPPAQREPLRARLRRIAPVAGILAAYFALYRVVEGGVAQSGGYVEPLHDPAAFLRAASVRMPVLLGDAFLRVPAELSVAFPPLPVAAVGAAVAVALALALRGCWRALPAHERVAARWLGLGALGATFVSLGGFPGGRLLVIANLGFAAVLAIVVRHATRAGVPRLRRGFATVLAALHVVLAPAGSLLVLAMLIGIGRGVDATARDAELGRSTRAFFVTAADPFATLYVGTRRIADPSSTTRCFSWLSAAHSDHRVTRTSERALAIEPIGTTLMRAPYELLFRSPVLPMPVGYEASSCGARVRVVAVEDGMPKRIEVSFDEPLDSPDLALLVLRGGALRKLALPEIGSSVEVPWSEGPGGIF